MFREEASLIRVAGGNSRFREEKKGGLETVKEICYISFSLRIGKIPSMDHCLPY